VAEPPTGTVTLLFSDIEASTRLLQRTGSDAYADRLAEHRRLLDSAFGRHNGFHVGSEGNAVFVVFASADDAAGAAGGCAAPTRRHPWPDEAEVRVRMGLHSGEPRLIERSYVGLDRPPGRAGDGRRACGQVLLSEATRALLDKRFRVRDLGDYRLKDLSGAQRLYQLLVDGLPAEFSPLRTLDNPPTNLPAQPNAFIGRARELEEIADLVARDDVRLVTPRPSRARRLPKPARSDQLDSRGAKWRAAVQARDGALALLVDARLRGGGTPGARGRVRAHRPPPARALLALCSLRLLSGSGEALLDDVHEALRAAEELGDQLTLAQAWNLLGRVEGTLMGTMGEAEEAWRQALDYAERGNFRAERAESIGWLMMSASFGPLPVDEAIALCRRFHDEAVDDPFIQANSLVEQAALEAMRGEFGVARELVAKGRQALADLGFALVVAMSAQEAHYVERLAGDVLAATEILRESYAELESMGERAYLSTAAALLAHMLYAQDELGEAKRFSRVSENTAAREDVFSQVLWRSARAKICARRGALDEAEVLARKAVELADSTDLLNTQGDTLVDLSEVLSLAQQPVEAASSSSGRQVASSRRATASRSSPCGRWRGT
jgi:class 3 adenylate cyclase